MSRAATPTAAAATANNAVLARAQTFPYRFETIDVSDTYIDSRYQRPLKAIKGDFKPWLVGCLTVSLRERRGKSFSVIDGQRRRDFIVREGIEQAPACVFYELEVEDEAAMFAELQRERRAITPFETFNAELAAKNPEAVAINRIIDEEGYEVAEQDPTMNQIKAIRAVQRIYRADPERLRVTLRLIRLAWEGMPFASREKMLTGVALFVAGTEDLDEQRFADRLKPLLPSEIDVRAQRAREAKGLQGTAPKYVAEVIQNAYRGRR